MVSILPSERSPLDVIGKLMGQSINQSFPGAVQQGMNRGMLQNSLDEIKKLASDPNSSPLDISLAAMKAGAGIHGSEKYLGSIIPELVKFAEARKSQQTRLAGEGQRSLGNQSEFIARGREGPRYDAGGEKGPQDIAKGNIGNIPQEATSGQKVPLLSPQEMIMDAKRLSLERTSAGIPTTAKEALEEIKEAEELKKLHNSKVDEELSQRVKGQTIYGQRALDYLSNVYPEASDELKSIFQRKGEIASGQGKSEAEINNLLATEAKRIKNAIVNVEKGLSPPRLNSDTLLRAFNKTYKTFDETARDMRSHLKPLLDMGLYDLSRNLLTKKGFYPEERDIVINPLTERSQSIINQTPENKNRFFKKEPITFEQAKNILVGAPVDLEGIKNTLKQIKELEPNFSLPLARKAFEDKGYDWRNFKDALNELEAEGFKLSDDQNIQKGILDTPPLGRIGEFLHSIKVIGR